jgi:hypothetical protein
LKNHETFSGEAQMYQELLEVERKLDWTMTRKKVEIEDALTRVQPVRQLSFFISERRFHDPDVSRYHGHSGYSLATRFPAKCGNNRKLATLPTTSILVKVSPHGS